MKSGKEQSKSGLTVIQNFDEGGTFKGKWSLSDLDEAHTPVLWGLSDPQSQRLNPTPFKAWVLLSELNCVSTGRGGHRQCPLCVPGNPGDAVKTPQRHVAAPAGVLCLPIPESLMLLCLGTVFSVVRIVSH